MNNPKNNISVGILVSKYIKVLRALDGALNKIVKQRQRITELEKQVNNTQIASTSPNADYWGRPKTSKKLIDDMAYEQQTEQRYRRLAREVKAKKLDINMLSEQEQIIVERLLNE